MDCLRPKIGNITVNSALTLCILHGMRSAGATLAHSMLELGYESCYTDDTKYYSNVLCYVDNILCTYHDEDSVLQWLYTNFPLKWG